MDNEMNNTPIEDEVSVNADESESDAIGNVTDLEERLKDKFAPEKQSGAKPEKQSGAKKLASSIFDIAEMFAVCAAIVLIVFTFCARLTMVDGSSMEDTLHNGEFILIRSIGYTPERGDIVVVDNPTAGHYAHPLIKRVIAVGGDTLDIDFETWTVTVNGEVVDESEYITLKGTTTTANLQFPITIKEGHVFVMGDNRNNSADSRVAQIGQIDERCVVGKAAVRIMPLAKFTVFD